MSAAFHMLVHIVVQVQLFRFFIVSDLESRAGMRSRGICVIAAAHAAIHTLLHGRMRSFSRIFMLICNKHNIVAVLLFATCKGKCPMKPYPADKIMARRSNALCIPSPSSIHFEMTQSHRCALANRPGKPQPSGRQTVVQ